MICRLSLDWLQQLLAIKARAGRKGALVFIDRNSLKTVNESVGVDSGDLRLKEVSQRLTDCVREFYSVAHLADDEFVVLLEGVSGSAEETRAKPEAAIKTGCNGVEPPFQFKVTENRNAAAFTDVDATANGISRRSFIDAYPAEDTERFFEPSSPPIIDSRASMEEDLRNSMEFDELVLYYQPQVDHTNLIGAEALVRWRHPNRGLLGPEQFISLAEETGLIVKLGDWVLHSACNQLAAWAYKSETAHISVAVNISARQFRQTDFVERVLAAICRTGADPRNLNLELTESLLVEDFAGVIEKMQILKSHGIRFSLDDFGTGYSSLAYLRCLPVDQLKIDRSFVRDMLADSRSGAIAQTIISLGKTMGLEVIAEGVEKLEQLDHLTQLGCHSFQGFLISQPLPLDQFERLLPVFA